jgi:DNA end-binding protein Ku
VVLREREEVVMVSPHDQGLLLYKLRYPQELRAIDDVPDLGKPVAADPAQLKLARSLVAAMSGPFAEVELKDRYHAALKEMIAAKIAGKEVVAVEEEERPVVDIMAALKESIARASAQHKPAAKTAAKPKKKLELVR